MDMIKKREKKALSKTKMNKSQGTVDFYGADDSKKGKRKLGDKKSSFNKFSGNKGSSSSKFSKHEGGGKYANRDKKEGQQDDKTSRSQIRRQK